MRWSLSVTLLSLIALAVPACSQQPLASEAPAPYSVPFTAMINSREHPIRAQQTLTGEEGAFYASRNEKVVYGSQPVAGFSTFRTYTFDAQPVSTLHGYGYRYRWVNQEGVSIP